MIHQIPRTERTGRIKYSRVGCSKNCFTALCFNWMIFIFYHLQENQSLWERGIYVLASFLNAKFLLLFFFFLFNPSGSYIHMHTSALEMMSLIMQSASLTSASGDRMEKYWRTGWNILFTPSPEKGLPREHKLRRPVTWPDRPLFWFYLKLLSNWVHSHHVNVSVVDNACKMCVSHMKKLQL